MIIYSIVQNLSTIGSPLYQLLDIRLEDEMAGSKKQYIEKDKAWFIDVLNTIDD